MAGTRAKAKRKRGRPSLCASQKTSDVIVAVRVEMQYVKWLLHVTTVRDV